MYYYNHKKIFLFAFCLLYLQINYAQTLEIWEIQGDSTVSQWITQVVETQHNIVTIIDSDGFFMQSPAEQADQSIETSNGIKVVTGTMPLFQIGQVVNVSGTIKEVNGMTVITNPNLEIELLNESRALPEPFRITAAFPATTYKLSPDLESLEGMLVQFDALVTSPSNFTNEVTLTTQSRRPSREPGIQFPGLRDLPVWDGNPELFWFDPDKIGAPNFGWINAGMRLQCDTAIMVQTAERYYAWPRSYQLVGEAIQKPARKKAVDEITLATLNMQQFKASESDYNIRMSKFALHIIEMMQAPDIIGIQETGGRRELEDLVQLIARNHQFNYNVYFETGNDGIHTAFLVNSDFLPDAELKSYLKEVPFRFGKLHDRPPILLTVSVPTNPPSQLHIMNLHLRSRRDIEDPENNEFVLEKRFEQSKGIAELVQTLSVENLIVIGDFNAFEFSDGYVDVVNQISGEETLGALLPPIELVFPSLTNQTALLPPEERYSFIFEGNTQLLDHCLVNDLPDFEINHLEFTRGNADNAWLYGFDSSTPLRSTDHDGFVLYLSPKGLLSSSDHRSNLPILVNYSNPIGKGGKITLDNLSQMKLKIQVINATGQTVLGPYVRNQERIELAFPYYLSNGQYWLTLEAENGKNRTFSIILQNQ